ncbi:fibronectin type III domain-containing protein [Frankia sp. Cr1]|uniref:fibronectin type III domain-containing protein n=1 Tax=Frankia sp. Cr1 TaxID=3073931 RepID=UPI002AD3448E|nr:hypothetical protein [Frankia sp. Cr1]
MARLTFPSEGSRLVYAVSGGVLTAVAAGTVVNVWTSPAANVAADCLHLDNTPVTTGNPLVVDAHSRLPDFYGPGGADTVWITVAGGPVTPCYAREDDRLDALAALIAALSQTSSTPGAPVNVAVVPGNGQVTVTFTAPSDGGSTITSYMATASTGQTASGASSPLTITGLTNGIPVTVTVRATNGTGTGPASNPAGPVTPATVPGAPTSIVATAGNGKATVAFTPPSSNGGSAIIDYLITASTGQTITVISSPGTIVGLINGVGVSFTVKSRSAIGYSTTSATSNVITPAAPATVWSGPPDVVHDLGTATRTTSGTTCTITTTNVAAIGNAIFVDIVANGAATPTVTDSAGNTYTIDNKASNGTATTVYQCTAMNVFAMPIGATITVTFDSARALIDMQANEIGGLKDVNTDPGDGHSIGSANTTTALVCGAIITTLGNDLVWNVYGYVSDETTPPTFTPGSGFTALGYVQAVSGTSSRVLKSQWKVIPAPTAVSPSATLGSAKSYTGVAWAYAAADPGTGALTADPSDPVAIGSNTVTSSSTTCVVTTTAAAAAGSSIALLVAANGAVTATATDDAGNTYVQDVTGAYATSISGYIITTHNISALASGGTITVTFASARTHVDVQAYVITGIASGNDGIGVKTGTTSSMTSQAIATSKDKCLVVGLFAVVSDTNTTSFTPASGWTTLAYSHAVSGSSSRDAYTQFRQVPTAGTVTPTVTASGNKNYVAVAVAYVPGTGATSQTGTYGDFPTLQSKTNSAIPGDVITLAAGIIFNGRYVLSGLKGTAANPITIIGGHPTTSVIDGGSTASGYVVALDQCSHVILKDFKIQNGQKGVVVDRSDNILIDGITATNFGQECIHFRNESTYCQAKNCAVSYTGQVDPGFGEAFYIGTARSNWGVTTTRKPAAAAAGAFPDLTHHITIGPGNVVRNCTAECVDLKEAALDNLVTGNDFDGSDIHGANSAVSWLSIKASRTTVIGNLGNTTPTDGYRTVTVTGIDPKFLAPYTNWDGTTQPGIILCSNNTFQANTIHGGSATGYGVHIVDGSNNVVYDDNTADGCAAGTANIPLTPAP